MNIFNITTEYPLWFVLFCIILAAPFTFILYKKHYKSTELSKLQKRLLIALRFISVFLISFLLLSPLIKTISHYIEKPIIIFAQDNSESIVINNDSAFYKTKYKEKIDAFREKIANKFEVRYYNFGNKISQNTATNFGDKTTNIANIINYINGQFSLRNVAGVVLATDGIYNEGDNPLYEVQSIKFPINTLALGDTTTKKDLLITDILCNDVAFLDTKFPMQIFFSAYKLANKYTKIQVFQDNSLVFSQDISINSNNYQNSVKLELSANRKGTIHYRIVLTAIDGEITTQNNFRDIVVEVLDNKQKILLLANSPHPDISAILQAIQKNKNFEVEYLIASEFNKNINDYNLIILHQIPSANFNASGLLSNIEKANIPTLFILGSQSNFDNINALNKGITINAVQQNSDEAQAEFNSNFALFDLLPEIKEIISSAPPLISPFGYYKLSADVNVLCYQKIKKIATSNPLIIFNNSQHSKYGMILGEGIWRWRMHNFVKMDNSNGFDEFVNKMVQLLALKVNKEQFVVKIKQIFSENEPITIEAELYNDSFELINTPDVNLKITNEQNKEFAYTLNKTDNAYYLNIGNLPQGQYFYKASVKYGNKILTKSGSFIVLKTNIEAQNITANHQLLSNIAQTTGGKMLKINDLDKFANELLKNENMNSISHQEINLDELINLKLFFFIILILLSLEWFLRKYWGVN